MAVSVKWSHSNAPHHLPARTEADPILRPEAIELPENAQREVGFLRPDRQNLAEGKEEEAGADVMD